MKYINTLSNSFVVGEKDDNGRIIEQFGFPKGGLTYLIKGVNVKFYLKNDYFYKNVIWSADAPLMIDGVLISVDNLPIALKKIFHQEAESVNVDTNFDTESFNAIANAPVSIRFNDLEALQGNISDKVDTLSGEVETKADISDIPTNVSELVNDANYITSADIPTNVSAFNNDAGYITSSEIPSLSGYATQEWVNNQNYFDGAEYDSNSKRINFKHSGATVAYIDATDFIKDGMVDSVELVELSGDTYLRITWNTDAGKEVINLNLGDIFNADNYYNKTETDNKLSKKLDASAYTPTDLSDYYTKEEVNDIADTKLDASAYTPSHDIVVDTELSPSSTNPVENKAIFDKVALPGSGTIYTEYSTSVESFNVVPSVNNIKLDVSETSLTGPSIQFSLRSNSGDTFETIGTGMYSFNDSQWVLSKGFGDVTYSIENNIITFNSPTHSIGYVWLFGFDKLSTLTQSSGYAYLKDVVSAHTADTTIHVTSADKTAWNAKLDASAYTPTEIVELTQAEYDAISGSVDPTTIYIITDAEEINANEYVTKASNIASGYTDILTPNASYQKTDAFNETVYYNVSKTQIASSSNYRLGYVDVYTSTTYNYTQRIHIYADITNEAVSADRTESNQYITTSVVDGELAVTPNEGYYFSRISTDSNIYANYKHIYSSGQSRNVIENTIYDVLEVRKQQITDVGNTMVTGGSVYVSDGQLQISLYTKTSSGGIGGLTLTSSTVNYDDNRLNVQFSSSTASQKVLNPGSSNYCQVYYLNDYNKAYNDTTILFNSNYSGSNQRFRIRFVNTNNQWTSYLYFTYNPSTTSITWDSSDIGTYATVTDTVSTDYKLKFVANEGYRICYLSSDNCSVGGVDNQNPNNFCTNLITTTSNVHNGQDVIDDLYSKVDGKVETSAITSSVTSASTNNEIPTAKAVFDAIPTGGSASYSAGRGIDITNDTISFSLPISSSTETLLLTDSSNNISDTNSVVVIGASNNVSSSNSARPTVKSIILGFSNDISSTSSQEGKREKNYIIGNNNSVRGDNNVVIGANNTGYNSTIKMARRSYIVGNSNSLNYGNVIDKENNYIFGSNNKVYNSNEVSIGYYNNSVSDGTTSGTTFFSIGNGTADNARHNAFEIRQNGDIYLTKDGVDIKLQDNLGSTIEVSSAITSGDTNAVAGGAVYDKFDEVEQVTARALNELNEKINALIEANEVVARALNDLNDRITALENA